MYIATVLFYGHNVKEASWVYSKKVKIRIDLMI
jgi:hypothetical protein